MENLLSQNPPPLFFFYSHRYLLLFLNDKSKDELLPRLPFMMDRRLDNLLEIYTKDFCN